MGYLSIKDRAEFNHFTHFKKSFGEKEIEYPGTFSKFLLPFGL